MKLRTAIAVAAISLAAVPMVTPADAFGIVIRFGGFHRVGGHHVARHHRSSGTRVARNRSRSLTPPKPVQTVSIGPQTLKTPDGDITVQGIQNNKAIGTVLILVVRVQRKKRRQRSCRYITRCPMSFVA